MTLQRSPVVTGFAPCETQACGAAPVWDVPVLNRREGERLEAHMGSLDFGKWHLSLAHTFHLPQHVSGLSGREHTVGRDLVTGTAWSCFTHCPCISRCNLWDIILDVFHCLIQEVPSFLFFIFGPHRFMPNHQIGNTQDTQKTKARDISGPGDFLLLMKVP